MTADDFAALLDRAYVEMRPWSASDVAATLSAPATVFLHRDAGGVIAQIAADTCEILAFATDPAAQRQGIATALLTELDHVAGDRGAEHMFLEVARGNAAARAFYAARGFAEIGTRPRYYTLRDGRHDDAVMLSRPIATGTAAKPPASRKVPPKSG